CDDLAQTREPLQAQRRERTRDGESADRRAGLSRALWGAEEVELRSARAGHVRQGVLYDCEDGVRVGIGTTPDWDGATAPEAAWDPCCRQRRFVGARRRPAA